MKNVEVKIHEVESWGQKLFRVMTVSHTGTIFGRIMTDFDSREDAEIAIEGEGRRNKINYRIV